MIQFCLACQDEPLICQSIISMMITPLLAKPYIIYNILCRIPGEWLIRTLLFIQLSWTKSTYNFIGSPSLSVDIQIWLKTVQASELIPFLFPETLWSQNVVIVGRFPSFLQKIFMGFFIFPFGIKCGKTIQKSFPGVHKFNSRKFM